jgi:hypothetical protein
MSTAARISPEHSFISQVSTISMLKSIEADRDNIITDRVGL